MPPRIRLLSICLLLSLAMSAQAAGKERPAPFSSLRWELLGSVANGSDGLHSYWTAGPGLLGQLRSPFYRGEFVSGMRVWPYEGEPGVRPSFTATQLYLGWGAAIALPARLELMPGFSFGTFRMSGDVDELPEGEERWAETEFCASLFAELSWHFSPASALHLRASATRVYTLRRTDLAFVSAGISHSFVTPGWLAEALR